MACHSIQGAANGGNGRSDRTAHEYRRLPHSHRHRPGVPSGPGRPKGPAGTGPLPSRPVPICRSKSTWLCSITCTVHAQSFSWAAMKRNVRQRIITSVWIEDNIAANDSLIKLSGGTRSQNGFSVESSRNAITFHNRRTQGNPAHMNPTAACPCGSWCGRLGAGFRRSLLDPRSCGLQHSSSHITQMIANESGTVRSTNLQRWFQN